MYTQVKSQPGQKTGGRAVGEQSSLFQSTSLIRCPVMVSLWVLYCPHSTLLPLRKSSLLCTPQSVNFQDALTSHHTYSTNP